MPKPRSLNDEDVPSTSPSQLFSLWAAVMAGRVAGSLKAASTLITQTAASSHKPRSFAVHCLRGAIRTSCNLQYSHHIPTGLYIFFFRAVSVYASVAKFISGLVTSTPASAHVELVAGPFPEALSLQFHTTGVCTDFRIPQSYKRLSENRPAQVSFIHALKGNSSTLA